MATIKSYTDLSQSKTLSKILPLESADMYYDDIVDRVTGELFIPDDGSTIKVGKGFSDSIVAWSLAALLSVLDFPSLTQNKEDEWEVCVFDHDNDDYINKTASNPVDACVTMIEKLHELNLL